jgi:hypothetical protein
LAPFRVGWSSFLEEEFFSASAGPQSNLAFEVVSHLLRERYPKSSEGPLGPAASCPTMVRRPLGRSHVRPSSKGRLVGVMSNHRPTAAWSESCPTIVQRPLGRSHVRPSSNGRLVGVPEVPLPHFLSTLRIQGGHHPLEGYRLNLARQGSAAAPHVGDTSSARRALCLANAPMSDEAIVEPEPRHGTLLPA